MPDSLISNHTAYVASFRGCPPSPDRLSVLAGMRIKTTAYFQATRIRPDRSIIQDAWIERAIRAPIREIKQADGRIRRWVRVSEVENRYLRVILLPDGETVHNAFFDRGFVP